MQAKQIDLTHCILHIELCRSYVWIYAQLYLDVSDMFRPRLKRSEVFSSSFLPHEPNGTIRTWRRKNNKSLWKLRPN